MNEHDNFLFFDLQALTPGKPFPGFAPGTFVDMLGREIELKANDLQTFIENTLNKIKEYKDRNMPGLPIDARNHDKGDAAGWIVGAELGEVKDSSGTAVPIIRILAEWTKLGAELIADKIQTNFSPTVDLEGKVIVGGSLTNWPASVDKNGVPLFTAVELAKGIRYFELQESLDEQAGSVRKSWDEKHNARPMYDSWVMEVFDDYVIASVGDDYFKVSYIDSDDGFIFAPRDEWTAVEKSWVEMAKTAVRNFWETVTGREPKETETSLSTHGDDTSDIHREVDDMNFNDLSDEERNTFLSQAREQVLAELAPGDDSPEDAMTRIKEQLNLQAFADVADLGKAREALLGQMQTALKSEYERMQANAGTMLAQMMSEIKREQHIADFAQTVTAGTEKHPRGLPVGYEEVEAFLSSLNDKQREAAESILARTVEHGLTDYAELGHGRKTKVKQPVPDFAVPSLKAAIAAGNTEAFFAAAGLGSADDYDLSAFTGEVK